MTLVFEEEDLLIFGFALFSKFDIKNETNCLLKRAENFMITNFKEKNTFDVVEFML